MILSRSIKVWCLSIVAAFCCVTTRPAHANNTTTVVILVNGLIPTVYWVVPSMDAMPYAYNMTFQNILKLRQLYPIVGGTSGYRVVFANTLPALARGGLYAVLAAELVYLGKLSWDFGHNLAWLHHEQRVGAILNERIAQNGRLTAAQLAEIDRRNAEQARRACIENSYPPLSWYCRIAA